MNSALGALTAPLGAEIIPARPVAPGVAPWERPGGAHEPPNADGSRARAAAWAAATENNAAATEGRRAERAAKKRERRRAAAAKLEETATRMWWIGLVGLPAVWAVSVAYFWTEFTERGVEEEEGDKEREEDREEADLIEEIAEGKGRIRATVRRSFVGCLFYCALFAAWVVTYQVVLARGQKGPNKLSILGSDIELS